MKKIYSLLLTAFMGSTLLGQQNITSVDNGNATNPLVWDCVCIPSPDDNVTVNHNIVMNSDWIVNGGGSITVNSGAAFIQDNEYRTILFDGGGTTFYNYGETELTNIGFSNTAEGHNHGTLSLDTALWVGTGSMYMNHALTQNVDSTYIQGMFMNEGTYNQGDFLNEGTITNTGYIQVDSLYNNEGTINSSAGNITTDDFASNGTVNITGSSYMIINNDFLNAGTLYLEAGRDIRIGSDFLNTSEGDTALVINDGLMEIGNDFSNIDTLRGSGLFCIANNSSNTGFVKGTLDICDNTGTGIFDFNTGTVDGTVTDCNAGCTVGVDQTVELSISIYPNPVSDLLHVEGLNKGQIIITDVMGQVIHKGKVVNSINVNEYKTGIYFITLGYGGNQKTMKFIKR